MVTVRRAITITVRGGDSDARAAITSELTALLGSLYVSTSSAVDRVKDDVHEQRLRALAEDYIVIINSKEETL